MSENDTPHINAIVITRPDPAQLPGRNVYRLFGRPLICWTLDSLKLSRLVTGVYVCTADEATAEVAREADCAVIPRPPSLDEARSLRVDILRHAVRWLEQEHRLNTDIALAVRATIPELRRRDVDNTIAFLDRHQLREMITVSPDCLQNDDLRIIHHRALFGQSLSHHIGVTKTDFIDVRSLDDIAALQTRYESRERFDATRE